jgi:hypothetical protein
MAMPQSDAYFFYEAGQAVAAAHLGLEIRHISGNPGVRASDIQLPRHNPKTRMILWLTGMAAEKKGVGRSDPLRRMRNRQRVRSQIEALAGELQGPPARRQAEALNLFSQSQDRANAICGSLYEAIRVLAGRLRESPTVSGQEVAEIVAAAKSRRPVEQGA